MFLSCIRGVLFALFLGNSPLLLVAQEQTQPPTKPDNTKVNKRDRSKDAATADQQKENATDRDLTKRIRRAIVEDKSLSTYAHNIKVVSQNGRVTLKGPVHSEDERKAIEAKAAEIAGADHVKNDISVMGDADRSKK